MLTGREREAFALRVIEEVRRWPGVEMRPHASPHEAGESDGVEFRLYGRQVGHLHGDCALHLALTKALKEAVIRGNLAEPLDEVAATSAWAMLNPITQDDAERAIWLLRLNYVRLRRQRLSPTAAATSEVLQEHQAALGSMSEDANKELQRTQARSRPRPIPPLEA
ncbi:MAG TPA: luciferase family protein [Gemmatimonadaceae bacterium]